MDRICLLDACRLVDLLLKPITILYVRANYKYKLWLYLLHDSCWGRTILTAQNIRNYERPIRRLKSTRWWNVKIRSVNLHLLLLCLSVCLSVLCVAFCLCSCVYLSAHTWLSHSMFVNAYLPMSALRQLLPKLIPRPSLHKVLCLHSIVKFICSDVV